MRYHVEGLIGGGFQYGVCSTEKEYMKEMKRLKISDGGDFLLHGYSATVHHFEKTDGQKIALVCMKKGLTGLQEVALLAHEAYHIHRANMRYIRENDPGEEVSAYCIQVILQIILGELGKVKFKRFI